MKSREFKRLAARYLLPSLPNMAIRGTIAYTQPVCDVLRGYYFQGSAFNKTFLVTAFVQPLYVPSETFVLTFGRRLGGGAGRWWDLAAGEAETMNEITAMLINEGSTMTSVGASAQTFAETAGMLVSNPPTLAVREAIGYSWLMAGQPERASTELQHVVDGIAADEQVGWTAAMRARAVWLLSNLHQDSSAVRLQLEQWRDQSTKALGVA